MNSRVGTSSAFDPQLLWNQGHLAEEGSIMPRGEMPYLEKPENPMEEKHRCDAAKDSQGSISGCRELSRCQGPHVSW